MTGGFVEDRLCAARSLRRDDASEGAVGVSLRRDGFVRKDVVVVVAVVVAVVGGSGGESRGGVPHAFGEHGCDAKLAFRQKRRLFRFLDGDRFLRWLRRWNYRGI